MHAPMRITMALFSLRTFTFPGMEGLIRIICRGVRLYKYCHPQRLPPGNRTPGSSNAALHGSTRLLQPLLYNNIIVIILYILLKCLSFFALHGVVFTRANPHANNANKWFCRESSLVFVAVAGKTGRELFACLHANNSPNPANKSLSGRKSPDGSAPWALAGAPAP